MLIWFHPPPLQTPSSKRTKTDRWMDIQIDNMKTVYIPHPNRTNIVCVWGGCVCVCVGGGGEGGRGGGISTDKKERLRPHSHYILNPDQLDTDQVDPYQIDLHQTASTLGLIWCRSRWSTSSCVYTVGQLDPEQADPDQVDADQIYVAAMWTQFSP